MIEDSTAARYTALPIAFAADGALLVAIEDPYNMPGISAIEAITRSEVRPGRHRDPDPAPDSSTPRGAPRRRPSPRPSSPARAGCRGGRLATRSA